jgi:hypothetical protein
MSEIAIPEVVGHLDGKNYAAVELAVHELGKHKLTLDGYKISVLRIGKLLYVIFQDEHQPNDTIGSGGLKPGFEVQIDPKTLEIEKSYFIR